MPRSREEREAEIARFEGILDSGVRDQLAALPGVVHVTHGLKLIDGAPTNDFAVTVFVEEKLPVAALAPENVVPPVVEGVPTDVLPVRTMSLYTLIGGTQITNGYCILSAPTQTKTELGTLGFVARLNNSKQTPVILGCAHVMGQYGAVEDDLIFQPLPGSDDIVHPSDQFPRKPRTSTNSVATIRKIVKNSNVVDCAIAEICTCRSWCCDCGDSYTHAVEGLHKIPDPHAPKSDALTGVAAGQTDMRVFKVGIKTHGTAGVIVTTTAPVKVNDYFGQTIIFQNQILIAGVPGTLFADHGDSGALLVNDQGKAVGMVTGGFPATGPDPSTAIANANHIGPIMTALDISLPARAKASATTVGGVRSEQVSTSPYGLAVLNALRNRAGRSALGRTLLEAITRHRDEVVALVNHRRRVTIAWHRGQGPTWLTAFTRSARHPDYRLPTELEGVSRAEAITALHTVLVVEGSDELRATLLELPEFLMSVLAECQSVDELLDRLDETAEQLN